MPDPDDEIPPGFTVVADGSLWPLDEWGNLIPSPADLEAERAHKDYLARIEAEQAKPLKSFNRLEQERLEDHRSRPCP